MLRSRQMASVREPDYGRDCTPVFKVAYHSEEIALKAEDRLLDLMKQEAISRRRMPILSNKPNTKDKMYASDKLVISALTSATAPMTISQLAKECDINRATMDNAVNRLLEAGKVFHVGYGANRARLYKMGGE